MKQNLGKQLKTRITLVWNGSRLSGFSAWKIGEIKTCLTPSLDQTVGMCGKMYCNYVNIVQTRKSSCANARGIPYPHPVPDGRGEGLPHPVPLDKHTPMKTVPSPFLQNAGGNNLYLPIIFVGAPKAQTLLVKVLFLVFRRLSSDLIVFFKLTLRFFFFKNTHTVVWY